MPVVSLIITDPNFNAQEGNCNSPLFINWKARGEVGAIAG
ncbi:hypothetical protein OSCI_780026 [Kamptonema sp. PCC 6506]|nr:hypothetical protein OSCI_780026 [Kamptonema sp. PCC 6506]